MHGRYVLPRCLTPPSRDIRREHGTLYDAQMPPQVPEKAPDSTYVSNPSLSPPLSP